MAGGLLSLVSQGQQSVLLYGTPSKTFFKTIKNNVILEYFFFLNLRANFYKYIINALLSPL